MRITKHALSRIRERNASVEDVVSAITTGKQMPNRTDPDNKLTIIDNKSGLYCVTDKGITTLITVFWRK